MSRHISTLCFFIVIVVVGRAQSVVEYTLTAAPGVASIAPGTTIPALLYNGVLPGPTLTMTLGQTLRVRCVNQLAQPTSLHFHGVNMPSGMDGVIGISRPAIAPGQEQIYEFVPPESGTYWYHPHVEDQMTSGLYGMLTVQPAAATDDPPFDQEAAVILHDDTTQAGGMMGGMMGGTAAGFAGHLLNGATSAGQTPIVVQTGQKLRLRILNAAARASYVVALDGHPLAVSHADGRRVVSTSVGAVPIGPGERYDAIVDLVNPGVWSLAVANITNRNATLVRGVVQYAGSIAPTPAASFVPANLATGSLLSYSQLAAFAPTGSIAAAPQRNYPMTLGMTMGGGMGGGMGSMAFTINGQSWPTATPFAVNFGETVQLNFANTTMMMMGSFRHPMHIHGHAWRLMGTAGGTAAPPVKDTLLIRPVGQAWSSASVQFLADNPGEWVIHCHDVEHMMMGMMNVFQYGGDADVDGLANASDWDPLSIYPVLTIPESAAAFAAGASGVVAVQCAAGTPVDFFFGLPAVAPLPLAPFGTLFIDFPTYAGTAVAGAAQRADFPYVLPPASAGLAGVRFGLQAVASVGFPPYALLTTWHPLTLQ